MRAPRARHTASVAAWAPAGARPPAVATRVRSPLHRRLPKRGFTSLTRRYIEVVRLNELQAMPVDEIDLAALKSANVVSILAQGARVILSGEITRAVTVRGLGVTKGAKAAIEAAGGSVVEA